jgi:hypothetical protein
LNVFSKQDTRHGRIVTLAVSGGLGDLTLNQNTPAPADDLRQLVEDLLEVSADGRKMANDLAQTIREIVSLQCDAIEERARLIQARAETLAERR